MHVHGQVSPRDAHNLELLANVHPPDWKNPRPASRYNLVVIGAGTAGLVTAAGAAGLGAKVALVERHLLGGDCLNVGCVPSKALIRSSRVVGELRRAAELGVRLPGSADVDFGAVMERMRRLRAQISHHDSVERFTQELGVDVFLGDARFTGSDTVDVGGTSLRFARAVLCTGARAAEPEIPGLAEAGFLTNETVFSLTERPRRLAVVGGGPIGCELAQALRRLGCEVTLLHDHGHLLDREDPDAAEIVQNAFLREGIALALGATLERVERRGSEKAIHASVGGAAHEIVVDEILIGAGRRPNVEGLDLEKVGVAYDSRSGVHVDDGLRTTNKRIFAAGDVCMQWKFTHAADFAARIVIQNSLFSVFGLGRKKLSALSMPWATYTDPEVAHVGLYEREAKARGIEIDTFLRPLSEVDRAVVDGETEGFVKIHVAKGSDRIVGGTIVSPHAGELIGELTLAIVGKIGLSTLAGVIHPYPTQAEALRQVGDLYNRTRLTPRVKALFRALLAIRR
jgi:pyruvate/2-oxoglutarate dehydrogenase complex dihydrolipoamide dehydrogenase (E3) component